MPCCSLVFLTLISTSFSSSCHPSCWTAKVVSYWTKRGTSRNWTMELMTKIRLTVGGTWTCKTCFQSLLMTHWCHCALISVNRGQTTLKQRISHTSWHIPNSLYFGGSRRWCFFTISFTHVSRVFVLLFFVYWLLLYLSLPSHYCWQDGLKTSARRTLPTLL